MKRIAIMVMALLMAAAILNADAQKGKYKEPPLLKQMVVNGLILPLEKRLPDNPLVIKTLRSIGKYGGTARVVNLRSPAYPWTVDWVTGYQWPFITKPDASPGVPNVFEGYEVNDNFTVYTFHLRKGLKWSDGVELTAENFLLYWKYEQADPLLSPGINSKNVKVEDRAVTFYDEGTKRTCRKEVIDPYTMKWTYDIPIPFLMNEMSRYYVSSWYNVMPLQPMHFMKQFLPAFVGEAAADTLAKKAGFDHWYQLYMKFSNTHNNPYSDNQTLGNFPPTMSSYVLVEKTQQRMVYERNPYFFAVDPQGNQLPYIDRIVCENMPQREMVDGGIISGEIDLEGFFTVPSSLPLYKKYEAKGGYKTVLWTFPVNATVFHFNYQYEDLVVQNLFRNQKFREALSIGFDRDRINNDIFAGQSHGGMNTVLSDTPWYKEDYEKKYAFYDPQKARALLDEIGVKDIDGDGLREDPNGKKIYWVIEWIVSEAPYGDIANLVTSYWKKDLGISADVKLNDNSLDSARSSTNKMAMRLWHGDLNDNLMFPISVNSHMFPSVGIGGNKWYSWWTSAGRIGEEPPQNVKDLFGYFTKMTSSTSKDEQKMWGLKMTESAAENVWSIGTLNNFPHPYIVKNDLNNVPMSTKDGPLYHVASTMWTNPYYPVQFYFTNRPQVAYKDSMLPVFYSEMKTMSPVERMLKYKW
jgi:peptide/nickel transport system substrate-binding protein